MGLTQCNHVPTGSASKPLTYVVLVILIALWAIVLVPPYLKDRRESTRTFRASQSGSLPAITSPQRFQPLRHAGPPVRTGSLTGPAVSPLAQRGSGSTGAPVMANSGWNDATSNFAGHSATNLATNVVQLHPVDDGIDVLGGPSVTEEALHQAWGSAGAQTRAGLPATTAAARERRRHILIGLTGSAFVTLLLAMTLRGSWIALNVAIDAALVGYVILLVRFRQIANERQFKVEPIRPPVTEQPPVTLQAAPDYLVRSGT